MHTTRRAVAHLLAVTLPLVAALPLALSPAAAQAQAYPSRPIKLMVPLGAGSTADILSRTVGEELAAALGQSVVVENKPAAGGTVAMGEVSRAAPDGYTISFASQGNLVFNQVLYAKPGYDSLKDFEPIIFVGGVSNVMVVPPDSPARSVADFIALAKAKPGTTFSSGGSGTSHHLSGVLFGQLTGTDLLHVPYKGAAAGILAVMSGEVAVGFFNTPTVINQIKGQKLRGLAVTSLTRSPLLPDLPTLDASGVKAYEVNTWFGFVAPAGTPAAIVTRLHDEVAKIMAKPDVRSKLAAQGFELSPLKTPAEFGAIIRADFDKWPAIIKKSGATVN